WQFYVALSLFILIIEAARRSGGLIFVSIVIVLGLYPIYADQMPDILWASPTSFSRTIAYNIYSNSGLLGVLIQVIGETIIGYLIFASLLVTTGASDFFLNFANACMGRAKGGAGKVSVLASGFFGSLSGSIFSNIISTGTMTIPSMKRGGLPAHYAGALEACASTGGMLMPPVMGAVAFIMADFTGTSYSTIVVAAAIPSILYYFGLYWHVHSYAERHELDGIPQDELPSISKTIREGWPILLVLAFLVWALVFMRWERLAPFYASALLLVFTSLRKSTRLSLKSIPGMLFEINKLLSQAMALLLPISFILG
ncbi:TRAP transporter permease, partial [Sulfitobacter sp. HI0129]